MSVKCSLCFAKRKAKDNALTSFLERKRRRRFMWWKVPALLVLGVPLLHRAWLEIQAHPAAIQPRAALPSRERLTARKADQEKLATDFESVVLPPEAARVVLRGSRDKVP